MNPKTIIFKIMIILNVVIMQNCLTHCIITVINATLLNFKQHLIFGVPLQTSLFPHYGLAYTVCPHFKPIWGIKKCSYERIGRISSRRF